MGRQHIAALVHKFRYHIFFIICIFIYVTCRLYYIIYCYICVDFENKIYLSPTLAWPDTSGLFSFGALLKEKCFRHPIPTTIPELKYGGPEGQFCCARMYLLLRTDVPAAAHERAAAAHGCTCCCARTSCYGARMYLLLRTNELLLRTDVPAAAHERAAAAHGCTCCCARTSCCGARMYLLLRTNELLRRTDVPAAANQRWQMPRPVTCQCLATFTKLKFKKMKFFHDVIYLLARVFILLIDTATQEVHKKNIWNKLSVQFLRYAIELLHVKRRTRHTWH